jgi:hypothetical protein
VIEKPQVSGGHGQVGPQRQKNAKKAETNGFLKNTVMKFDINIKRIRTNKAELNTTKQVHCGKGNITDESKYFFKIKSKYCFMNK